MAPLSLSVELIGSQQKKTVKRSADVHMDIKPAKPQINPVTAASVSNPPQPMAITKVKLRVERPADGKAGQWRRRRRGRTLAWTGAVGGVGPGLRRRECDIQREG